MKLSEKLRRERIKRGLPSSGVAWMCGMSLAPYSRIENDRREPTLVHAVLFEALFLMEEEGLLVLFALRVKKLRSEMVGMTITRPARLFSTSLISGGGVTLLTP